MKRSGRTSVEVEGAAALKRAINCRYQKRKERVPHHQDTLERSTCIVEIVARPAFVAGTSALRRSVFSSALALTCSIRKSACMGARRNELCVLRIVKPCVRTT